MPHRHRRPTPFRAPARDLLPAPAGPPIHGPHGPLGSAGPGPLLPDVLEVADVPASNTMGVLSRVPALPLGYVVRDELDGLIDAVVGATGGAVGLTGEPAGVGLHGIGGIGKSVLAAALATDDRIRRRFPDGVYWVTVGERPDVLAVQLDLLSRLGARPTARTRSDATQALRTALVEKRVLLVVDDVWAVDDAQDFRVTGPHGRLLYTSRDQGVVAAVGATPHPVKVLSPAAARALAGEVLKVPAATLPEAADRAFAAVGYVPLAVALLAAAVRGRQEWEQRPTTGRTAGVPHRVRGRRSPPTSPATRTSTAPTLRDDLPPLNIAVAALRPIYGRRCSGSPSSRRTQQSRQRRSPATGRTPVAVLNRRRLPTSTASWRRRRCSAAATPSASTTWPASTCCSTPTPCLRCTPSSSTPTARCSTSQTSGGRCRSTSRTCGSIWLATSPELATATGSWPQSPTRPTWLAASRATARTLARPTLTVAARLLPDQPSTIWWQAWLARHAHLLQRHRGSNTRLSRLAGTLLAWLEADASRPTTVRTIRLTPLLPQPYLAVQGALQAEPSALIRVFAEHSGKVLAVAWRPDSSRVATADDVGIVHVWGTVSGESFVQLTNYPSLVLTIAWSPDGTRLATAGTGGTIRVWDSINGTILNQLVGQPGGVDAMAWSPDGTRLAAAGTGGAAQIWELTTGRILKQLTGHTGRVMAVAWSPDSARVATAGSDGVIRIWQASDGEPTLHLTGHRDWVLAIAWRPQDGTRLATAGDGGSARIWDALYGTALSQVTGHHGGVMAAAWSRDGTCLATAGEGGTVRNGIPSRVQHWAAQWTL